jgi:hypothetical protein
MPSEDRLREYALLFSSGGSGNREPVLRDRESLTADERRAMEALETDLRALRDLALVGVQESLATESVESFWAFHDGRPIVIIGSEQPPEVLAGVPEADKHHPDFVEFMHYADADAVVEIFGQIRADNPTSDVRCLLPPAVRNNEHLTHHVVVIGGAAVNRYAEWFAQVSEVPAPFRSSAPASLLDPGNWQQRYFSVPAELARGLDWPDVDFGEDDQGNAVARLSARMRGWVTVPARTRDASTSDDARDRVENVYQDLALIARQPNPLDPTATVTLVYGLFSRGTFGAARALTDPEVRQSNQAYLRTHFDASKRFWMLCRVLCDRRLPLTNSPDFHRPGTVLIARPG